jgi:hypothetical protein
MRTAACRQIEERLVELIEHSAPSELRKEMQAHLAECPRCERLARDFSELWGELGPRARREPPVSLWPSLARALDTREEHPFRSSAFLKGFLGLLRPAAVSLAVLIAVLAGYMELDSLYLQNAEQPKIEGKIAELGQMELELDNQFEAHQQQISALLTDEQKVLFDRFGGLGMGPAFGMGYGAGYGRGMARAGAWNARGYGRGMGNYFPRCWRWR